MTGPTPAVDGPTPAAEQKAGRRTPRTPSTLRLVLAIVFGLFFAYRIWEVVESLVQILGHGASFSAVGWVIMVLALLVPIGAFGAAFLIGRRSGLLVGILAYLVAFAAASAVFYSLIVLLGAAGGIVAG